MTIPRSRILAAMPAYNEESHVGSAILNARRYADEVIVVDDGSRDKTAEIARLAGATVIQHEANRGYGAAIQTILAEAKKRDPDVLVLLDADYQHNPGDIPRMVGPIQEGFDLVIGSRHLQKEGIPLYRRIGQKIILRSTCFAAGKQLTDSECGFRVFSRRALSVLEPKEKGMAVSAEIVVQAAKKGLQITEVPISVTYDGDGSTLNPVRHGMSVLSRVVVMISERRPLFFFSLAGAVFLAGGLFFGFKTVDTVNAGYYIPTGTALLSVLLVVIAVLSFFTGIILNVLIRWKI